MRMPFSAISIIAIGAGIAAGIWAPPLINNLATFISTVFMQILKLLSLPLIFLSLVSTLMGLEGVKEAQNLGKKVLSWTLITTVIAAFTACMLFIAIDPAKKHPHYLKIAPAVSTAQQMDYCTCLKQIIPSNIIEPFATNNVMGILLLAIMCGIAGLYLPHQQRKTIHELLSALFAMVLKIISALVKILPIAIWAFMVEFVSTLPGKEELYSLGLYLLTVAMANLIQGLILLPLLLKLKKISPLSLFKAMFPALTFAFFSKSSSATIPLAMQCAEENAHISRKVSGFSFPLCTTINMNGCAAFIFITVLYVSIIEGVSFSYFDMGIWILIATAAAVGNAGVPMGCFFLSSTFLASMQVPLNIMGLILPFYALLDMLETALNVWSDSCVTAIVDYNLKKSHFN